MSIDIDRLRRHSRDVERYDLRRQQEAERFNAENQDECERVAAAVNRSNELPPGVTFGSPAKPLTQAETDSAFALHNRRQMTLAAFDHAHKPPLTPWDTPSRLLAGLDEDASTAAAIDRIWADTLPPAEADAARRERLQSRYVKARGEAMAFARFDPATGAKLQEARDPAIGLQDVRAWAEAAAAAVGPMPTGDGGGHADEPWPAGAFVAATSAIAGSLTADARRRLRDELAPRFRTIAATFAAAGRADLLIVRHGPHAPAFDRVERWAATHAGGVPILSNRPGAAARPASDGADAFRFVASGRRRAWDAAEDPTAMTTLYVRAADPALRAALRDTMRAGGVAAVGGDEIDFAWLMAEALGDGDAEGVDALIAHAGPDQMGAFLAIGEGRPLRWSDDGEPGMDLGTRLCRIADAATAALRAIDRLAVEPLAGVATPAPAESTAAARVVGKRRRSGRPATNDAKADAKMLADWKASGMATYLDFANACNVPISTLRAALARAKQTARRITASSPSY